LARRERGLEARWDPGDESALLGEGAAARASPEEGVAILERFDRPCETGLLRELAARAIRGSLAGLEPARHRLPEATAPGRGVHREALGAGGARPGARPLPRGVLGGAVAQLARQHPGRVPGRGGLALGDGHGPPELVREGGHAAIANAAGDDEI